MSQTILALTWDITETGDILVELSNQEDVVLAEIALDPQEVLEALVEDLATPDPVEFEEAVEEWQRVAKRLRELSDRITNRVKDYMN